MKRLTGVGDARISADSAADRFDIGRARPGLGAAELLDHLRMLPLGFGDVLRIESARLLRRGRRDRQRTRAKPEKSHYA